MKKKAECFHYLETLTALRINIIQGSFVSWKTKVNLKLFNTVAEQSPFIQTQKTLFCFGKIKDSTQSYEVDFEPQQDPKM